LQDDTTGSGTALGIAVLHIEGTKDGTAFCIGACLEKKLQGAGTERAVGLLCGECHSKQAVPRERDSTSHLMQLYFRI